MEYNDKVLNLKYQKNKHKTHTAIITEDKVTEIFYMADEYSRKFSKVRQKYSLEDGQNDSKRRRNKPNRMSDAETMVILRPLCGTGEGGGPLQCRKATASLNIERYVQDIKGKLYGDRGYVGKALFEMLFINGIQLITCVRNM